MITALNNFGTAVSAGPLVKTAKSQASFASLLSNGRSVSQIAQERAFGFSETGILGVFRNVPLSPNGSDNQSASIPNHAIEGASKELATTPNPISDTFVSPTAQNQACATEPTSNSFGKPGSAKSNASKDDGHAANLPTRRVRDGQIGARSVSLVTTSASPILQRPKRMGLRLIEENDEVSVHVSGLELSSEQKDEIVKEIMQTGREYGVTFNRISLNINVSILDVSLNQRS